MLPRTGSYCVLAVRIATDETARTERAEARAPMAVMKFVEAD